MTDQEINERIAEFCGWKEIPWDRLSNPREAIEAKHFCRSNEDHFCGWLPSYTSNLNAIHEAETTLRREGEDGQGYSGSREWFQASLSLLCDEPIHATALERAKAFLETIEYLGN
jgi:hypothetical protein